MTEMSNDGGNGPDAEDGEVGRNAPDQSTASTASLSLDETLELLANYERRRVLGFLMDAPDGTAAMDELVDHLSTRRAERVGERPGRSHVTTTLHHVHLPKLADAGVVEYDARGRTVRYRADERLEEWFDHVRKHEEQ